MLVEKRKVAKECKKPPIEYRLRNKVLPGRPLKYKKKGESPPPFFSILFCSIRGSIGNHCR